jgi:SAM-dependent methyltransferase
MSAVDSASDLGRALDGTPADLRAHVDLLRERVFDSARNLPQFDLLFAELLELARSCGPSDTVVALERTLLYRRNPFAAFFRASRFVSLDCSPRSADERGAYNARLVADERFLDVPHEARRCAPERLDARDASADVLVIPNLVHHVREQRGMFAEAHRVVRPGGRVYVFEPLLRELHQEPDDYLRYTPYGLADVLERAGFVVNRVSRTGGPFSAIVYCWLQALQYVPEDQRERLARWFHDEHLPELMRMDDVHRTNRVRQWTSFPTAFSVTCTKPA